LEGLPVSTGYRAIRGPGDAALEMITSFLTALPSRQGILLGVAAFLAILVLTPDRQLRAEALFNTVLAVVIGFLVAYAVG
jgi:hypothetical protein